MSIRLRRTLFPPGELLLRPVEYTPCNLGERRSDDGEDCASQSSAINAWGRFKRGDFLGENVPELGDTFVEVVDDNDCEAQSSLACNVSIRLRRTLFPPGEELLCPVEYTLCNLGERRSDDSEDCASQSSVIKEWGCFKWGDFLES